MNRGTTAFALPTARDAIAAARLHEQHGRTHAAVTALRAHLRAHVDDADVWAWLAQLHLRSDEHAQACDAALRALMADPIHTRALICATIAGAHVHDAVWLRAYGERAYARDPEHGEVAAALARAYDMLGERDAAARMYIEAMAWARRHAHAAAITRDAEDGLLRIAEVTDLPPDAAALAAAIRTRRTSAARATILAHLNTLLTDRTASRAAIIVGRQLHEGLWRQ